MAIDEALAFTNPDGSFFLTADALGSTVTVTDAPGNAVTEYSYDPFGAVSATNPAFPNSFQFTGGENDDPSGLYYYRARYYSPPPGFPNAFQFTGRESEGLGGLHYYRARYYHPGFHRFISEDPIGFQGGDANLYAYVGNAPTNATDPKGLSDGRPDSSRGCRGDCL